MVVTKQLPQYDKKYCGSQLFLELHQNIFFCVQQMKGLEQEEDE